MYKSLLLVFGLGAYALADSICAPSDKYCGAFIQWMHQYDKHYTTDTFLPAYEAFKTNMDYVNQSNGRGFSHTLALNEFSDLTNERFRELYTGIPANNIGAQQVKNEQPKDQGPKSKAGSLFTWQNHNPPVITDVKNQGQCGSCWAFSSTGTMEGAKAINTGKLISLSEQQLVDCSGQGGCGGGWPDQAMMYVVKYGGITTEDAYPYKAVQGTCNMTGKALVSAFSAVNQSSSAGEAGLVDFVNRQPTSVLINGGYGGFQGYHSGIFNDTGCDASLDHAVLMVGYGTDATTGQDYWILKNSWTAGWGEQGYMRIARGLGMCGLGSWAASVTDSN